MENDKTISNLMSDLTFEQNMQFAVSCVNRIKCFTKLLLNVNLEKYFESLADIISKPKLRRKINTIIDDLNNYPIENFDWQKHRDFFSHFNNFDFFLSIDYVETAEDIKNDIVSNFSSVFRSVLDYIYWHDCMHLEGNDIWCIRRCSESLISIVEDNYKISKFGKYTENQYKEEIKEVVDSEIKKQITILKFIKEGNEKLLYAYIRKTNLNIKAAPVRLH
jgi:hypothetical protein